MTKPQLYLVGPSTKIEQSHPAADLREIKDNREQLVRQPEPALAEGEIRSFWG